MTKINYIKNIVEVSKAKNHYYKFCNFDLYTMTVLTDNILKNKVIKIKNKFYVVKYND